MTAKPTTLVLMGRTGNGKSATSNSILGRVAFKECASLGSVTKECKMEQTTRKDGRIINVIDTPGLFDTNVPRELVESEIVKCIELAKDGIYAVLFVLSVRNRFTDEEAEAMDELEMLFGPTIVNYTVIVFTGGDELVAMGKTLEQYLECCPTKLKRIISRCNSRMVDFNNCKNESHAVKEKQLNTLMEHVDRIFAENGNQPYSNELFVKAQEIALQLYHIKDRERVYEEQIKLLNEMMEKNMRAMEEKIQCETSELLNKLEIARLARTKAESDALSVKQDLDVQIFALTKQLNEEKTKNAGVAKVLNQITVEIKKIRDF